MMISLSFKSYDSKSTMIFTWQDGEIIKRYNGKPYGKYRAEPPQSVAAFEALCRKRFLLGQKWRCQALVGVAS